MQALSQHAEETSRREEAWAAERAALAAQLAAKEEEASEHIRSLGRELGSLQCLGVSTHAIAIHVACHEPQWPGRRWCGSWGT